MPEARKYQDPEAEGKNVRKFDTFTTITEVEMPAFNEMVELGEITLH